MCNTKVKVEIDWADSAEQAEAFATEDVAVEVLQMQGDNGWPLVQLTGTRQAISTWLMAYWTDDALSAEEALDSPS